MMREVAGSSQERRPAVFVAAVPAMRSRPREGLRETGPVLVVESEGENARIVGAVLALAKPCADDHSGNGGLVEHESCRHVGKRYAVLAGDRGKRGEDSLEHAPSANGVDEALVLHAAPIAEVGRLGPRQPALREQAAGQRAVGKQTNAAREAEIAHCTGSAPIEHGKGDLVRDDWDPLPYQHSEVVGIEVGDADVSDEALLAQPRELARSVEVGEVLEAPPMKLQEVDGRDVEPFQAKLDPGAYDLGRHRPRGRAPLGEGDGALAARLSLPRQEPPGDDLSAPVVVGHVERVEPVLRIGGKMGGAHLRVERPSAPLHVGDLPEPGHDATDGQAGRKLGPVGAQGRLAHPQPPILALSALTSSVDISPTVVTLPSVIFQSRNGPVMSPYLSKVTGPM